MSAGLQYVVIAIALVVIALLVLFIRRQLKTLSAHQVQQEKTRALQQKRRDEMIESIRMIAMAVEADQVEYSEACLRFKGLLDHIAPELLEDERFRVFQDVHDKISHMPTHRARKQTDTETLRKLDKERFAVEKEYADDIRAAAAAIRHQSFN